MKTATFFLWISLLTLILTIGTYLMASTAFFAGSFPISFGSIIFFTILTIGAHYLGVLAARSKNQNHLTQLTMVLVFFKLFSCLLIVFLYDRIFDPPTSNYLLLFFLIYLTYTIFEVIVLTQANRITSR
ncbi:MAG: hypothetical protein HKN87_09740 [Saprospiraceae bacterium]|nr:hypothetical protein [Saprospiraceae bacterium]